MYGAWHPATPHVCKRGSSTKISIAPGVAYPAPQTPSCLLPEADTRHGQFDLHSSTGLPRAPNSSNLPIPTTNHNEGKLTGGCGAADAESLNSEGRKQSINHPFTRTAPLVSGDQHRSLRQTNTTTPMQHIKQYTRAMTDCKDFERSHSFFLMPTRGLSVTSFRMHAQKTLRRSTLQPAALINPTIASAVTLHHPRARSLRHSCRGSSHSFVSQCSRSQSPNGARSRCGVMVRIRVVLLPDEIIHTRICRISYHLQKVNRFHNIYILIQMCDMRDAWRELPASVRCARLRKACLAVGRCDVTPDDHILVILVLFAVALAASACPHFSVQDAAVFCRVRPRCCCLTAGAANWLRF